MTGKAHLFQPAPSPSPKTNIHFGRSSTQEFFTQGFCLFLGSRGGLVSWRHRVDFSTVVWVDCVGVGWEEKEREEGGITKGKRRRNKKKGEKEK